MREHKRVKGIKKQTDNRFVNMYELDVVHRSGKPSKYFMASRADGDDSLKLNTEKTQPDAVMVYALADDKLVLERQFRYVIDDYMYELPAGLTEEGEDIYEAASREFFEETGMKFDPFRDHSTTNPFFLSAGMSDECMSTVFGSAYGLPDSGNQEDTEDITVVLADRDECRRILKEEQVSIEAAFLMLCYINSDRSDPFGFLIK